MPADYLVTSRVRLRQYEPRDFERLVELNGDPEVTRYVGGASLTRADIESGVERTLMYRERYGGRLGVFTAELLSDGEFMGWFLLRPDRERLDDTANPELGYRLKRKFWGRGYATEASRALVAKAFDELGAASVWAQALAANAASRRVLEKCGLTFEKEFVDPHFPGEGKAVLYRLRRAERPAAQGAGAAA